MAGPRHVVLLDGLVERGLAEEQEAQANPHGQQPGHGGMQPGGRWEREGQMEREGCISSPLPHTQPPLRGQDGDDLKARPADRPIISDALGVSD